MVAIVLLHLFAANSTVVNTSWWATFPLRILAHSQALKFMTFSLISCLCLYFCFLYLHSSNSSLTVTGNPCGWLSRLGLHLLFSALHSNWCSQSPAFYGMAEDWSAGSTLFTSFYVKLPQLWPKYEYHKDGDTNLLDLDETVLSEEENSPPSMAEATLCWFSSPFYPRK